MAFEEYTTHKGSRDIWKNCVIVSGTGLRLGDDFWENGLGKCARVRLFFDKEKVQIGILPVQKGKAEGMKIQFTKGRCPVVKCVAFMKRFFLNFGEPKTCVVKSEAGPNGMKVIDVRGGEGANERVGG